MVKVQTNSQGKVYLSNGNALLAGTSSAVISTLNVTPTTSAQTITAPSGVDGYSPVEVSAVTSSIDANITAGNIKDGVSILGVTGNYTGGGGSSSKYGATIDALLGNVDSNGVLQIPSGGNVDLIFTGVQKIAPSSLQYKFQYNNAIRSVTFPSLTTIDEMQALGNTFNFCQYLTSASFPSLTSINAGYAMSGCFVQCTGLSLVSFPELVSIGSGSFSAPVLERCFSGCTALTQISFPKLTTFGNNDIFGNMSYSYIFDGCSNLTEIHFNSNAQAAVSALTGYADKWGASNATIYFDL